MRHVFNAKLTASQEKTVLEDSSVANEFKIQLLEYRSKRLPLPEDVIAELEEYFDGRSG